jgi:3-hydroxyisobutyrate dehydrogenase-like beta-hydroxyacid dehydrogenase
MKVGFIGLGRMGQGMAMRLHKAGNVVTVYDVFPEQAAGLKEAGAIVADSVAAAAAGQDAIITMLPSDAILDGLVHTEGGLLESMSENMVHVMMGTHGVDVVRKLTASHNDAGQVFVAAHVLGRPDLAATGQLSIVPAGPTKTIEMLQPLFDVLGKRTFVAGTEPQAATAVKIANNFVLGSAIEVMGEAFALARKLGVDASLMHEVLTEGLFGAPAYEVYGKMIVDQAWDSIGATAVIGLKDANLALQAAEAAEMPLPSANIWRDRLLGAIARGEGHLDWAVMAREQARASGLDD